MFNEQNLGDFILSTTGRYVFFTISNNTDYNRMKN